MTGPIFSPLQGKSSNTEDGERKEGKERVATMQLHQCAKKGFSFGWLVWLGGDGGRGRENSEREERQRRVDDRNGLV